ncbi:MAG TPA: DUF2007 domain-containing protein [Verrucomicrobiae bacterium]
MKENARTENSGPVYRIPPLAANAPKEGWVTLVKCGKVMEADFLRSRLEAEGIEVFIPDENLMATAAWALNEFGYIRVQVAPGDYERAREMLVASGDAVGE